MIYTEYVLNTPEEEIENRCARLEELGVNGFVIESEQDFKSFLKENKQYWDYVDEQLESNYKGLSQIKFYLSQDEDTSLIDAEFPEAQKKTVRDEDWENNWRQYYRPIEIGEKIVVVPQWEKIPDNGRIPLVLDPGLIFGTGSHATTKMCLELLQNIELKDKKVLDLGCGSGILGIGAMLLGAESCTAIDIDEKAPDVVKSNAALNNVEIEAFSGNVLSSEFPGYDIVIANIVADVIIALAPKVRSSKFICSGIIDGRDIEVEKALKAAGFTIEQHRHLEEWNAYYCVRIQ